MKKKIAKYPRAASEPDVLKDADVLEHPLSINVRAAKDSLSSLIERAAQGHETIITSDGVPKAKLVPIQRKRKPFHADWELLKSIPIRPGARRSEDIIREDRDSGY